MVKQGARHRFARHCEGKALMGNDLMSLAQQSAKTGEDRKRYANAMIGGAKGNAWSKEEMYCDA